MGADDELPSSSSSEPDSLRTLLNTFRAIGMRPVAQIDFPFSSPPYDATIDRKPFSLDPLSPSEAHKIPVPNM